MQLVVLAVGGVEVEPRVFVDPVVAQDLAEEVHRQEVGIGPGGSVEEDTHVQVRQLVVAHVDDRGRRVGLLRIV